MANKKRMISYDVLMKHLDSCIKEGKGLVKSICVAIKCFVEQMPAVDAVEVVRCKDCMYWNSETGFCCKHSRFYHGGLDWDMFNDDDSCSYGERKSNGES